MNIKNTLFNFTLLGLGGVGGYFIAKKKLQGKYQDDLADVQDFYYKKLQESGIMDEDFEPEEPEEPTDEEVLKDFMHAAGVDTDGDDPNAHLHNIVELSEKRTKDEKKKTQTETSKDMKFDKGKGRPIINYNKPPLEKILADIEAEKDEGDEEIDDPDEPDIDAEYEAEIQARAEEFAQRRCANQASGEPYCINHDEYEDSEDEYEKQVLYYYAQDRVLCEDDDSIVDDEEIVGLDYEDTLSMQTTAWVRNDRLCTQYEIHRIDDSYNNVIANAIETPREREFRLVGRRKQALDDIN